MGTHLPPLKGAQPHFSAHVYCGQMAGWIKMPLGVEVSLGPGHIVLDGDSALPKRGHNPPQFSAHGQMAGWIKMPLGMEVGFSPGHIVLHGDPASPHKGHSPQVLAHVYCGQTVAHCIFALWFLLSFSFFTGSIACSASRRYLIYSEADFEDFHPTGATRCTDGGEIWHGGRDRRSTVSLSMPNFTPFGATTRV